jgi:hypothetical protein
MPREINKKMKCPTFKVSGGSKHVCPIFLAFLAASLLPLDQGISDIV